MTVYGSDRNGNEYTIRTGRRFVTLITEDEEDVTTHLYTSEGARRLASRLLRAAEELDQA
ncbi:TPA: hypothetical protein OQU49_004414 [Shigella flexneri]|nr:hypothetical protein [Shigella flexneri]